MPTRRSSGGCFRRSICASVCRRSHLLKSTALIKAADRQAAYLEATRLAGFEAAEAQRFFGRPPAFSASLEREYLKPWPAETAQARYFERFSKLLGA